MARKSTKTYIEFSKDSIQHFDALKERMRGADKASPSNVEVLLFAMAFGFRAGNRVAEITKSGTGVRVEYLRPEHEALLAAVQLATTKSNESLVDLDERYSIAEQYAEGGIRLLALELDKPGDFNQSIASELVTMAKVLEVLADDDE
ncbi:MAG: hypothetical protein RLZZ600_875 [Actinomycetota bacterium]|jgi:hypothetical protein